MKSYIISVACIVATSAQSQGCDKVLSDDGLDTAALQACLFQLSSAQVPAGAVIAFDREDGCPSGWRDMGKDWRGRMIVAAASSENDTYSFGRTGGAEVHVLTEDEMPKHEHAIGALSGTEFPWFGPSNSHPIPTNDAPPGQSFDWSSGEGHPHNNMPPYIALYFCKKE